MVELAIAKKLRILLVDDDVFSAELLADVLNSHGQETRAVADGMESLAIAREFIPHVAILDLEMPGLDGFQIAEALRREVGTDIQIFALSGWNTKAVRDRCRDSGFDRFFAKPIPLEQIIFALSE